MDQPAKGRPVVAARGIVYHEGRVLLLRAQEPGRTYYFLPGGHVAHGERLADAVVREVREETGLRVTVERPLYVREFIASRHARRPASMPKSHHALAVIFLCRLDEPTDGRAVQQLGHFEPDQGAQGVEALEWVSLSNLAGREIHPPQLQAMLSRDFPPKGNAVEFWEEEP
ncbi:MAG: NUDIX domain-containing protein [Planctomycetaceae bacterium]|nr:hypothetical protein [Planctomycetota bacterium]MCQ3950008.1 hypothetical protein [Planctomycetota bacterium]NUO16553.1 NUDIX domain-containing protein [Planctomycetaceae bacterium]GIK51814.1 MAG: hypothetical protein BroJett014_07870 [Planctomycetota bacterium]